MCSLSSPPGFIVVAACVMTFEARDSAAKSILQRSHKPLSHMTTGSSIHRHKVSPNRTDSSRRHTGPGNPGKNGFSSIIYVEAALTSEPGPRNLRFIKNIALRKSYNLILSHKKDLGTPDIPSGILHLSRVKGLPCPWD